MKQVAVVYHHEDRTWWAESTDLPGFSAAAESFAAARTMVAEGVDFYLDGEEHVLFETLEDGAILDTTSNWYSNSSNWYSSSVVSGIGQGLLPSGPQGLVVREMVAA